MITRRMVHSRVSETNSYPPKQLSMLRPRACVSQKRSRTDAIRQTQSDTNAIKQTQSDRRNQTDAIRQTQSDRHNQPDTIRQTQSDRQRGERLIGTTPERPLQNQRRRPLGRRGDNNNSDNNNNNNNNSSDNNNNSSDNNNNRNDNNNNTTAATTEQQKQQQQTSTGRPAERTSRCARMRRPTRDSNRYCRPPSKEPRAPTHSE